MKTQLYPPIEPQGGKGLFGILAVAAIAAIIIYAVKRNKDGKKETE
ncbi:MAG: hypothetical protein M0R40_09785 [Firmicutes bacterium]|nr:hypothetical protein [Bacillota bacterium]